MRVETISLEDYFGRWHENLRVCVNARSLEELAKALRIDLEKPESWFHTLRSIVEPESQDAYIWCAGKGTHDAVAEQLGFDFKKCYYQNITKTETGWKAEWMSGASTDHMAIETMYRCELKVVKIFGLEDELNKHYGWDKAELAALTEPAISQAVSEATPEPPIETAHEKIERMKKKASQKPTEPDVPDPEYTPEKWAEMVTFFKAARGTYYRGCIFQDCMHTIAAKFLGTYNGEHQYDHEPDSDCQACHMAHFR